MTRAVRLGKGLRALPAMTLPLHLPLAMPQDLALTRVQTLPQGLALTPARNLGPRGRSRKPSR